MTLKSTGRDRSWTGDELHVDAAILRTPRDSSMLPTWFRVMTGVSRTK